MKQALEQARAALEPFAAVDPGDSPDDFALSMATPDITCGMIRALQSAKAAIDAALAAPEEEVVERVARALCRYDMESVALEDDEKPDLDAWVESEWVNYSLEARAAIAAMDG